MREIKFRAYVKSLGWMLPVERICFDCKTVEVDLTDGNGDTAEYDFDKVELLQYTGLKDKDDNDIYEGDILFIDRYIDYPDGDYYFVRWEKFGYSVRRYRKILDRREVKCVLSVLINSSAVENHSKVIGNIYEHPHLLEDKA